LVQGKALSNDNTFGLPTPLTKENK